MAHSDVDNRKKPFSDYAVAVSNAIRTSCAEWFSHPENSVIFVETGITKGEYRQRYEKILVDFFSYFLLGGRTDPDNGNLKTIQKDVVPFLNRLHPGYTKTHEFLNAVYLLKRIFLSSLPEETHKKMDIAILRDIHERFDTAIETLTTLFSKNGINILESCNQAFDLGTIISIANPKGIILYANEAFCQLSEYAKDELIGKPHNIVRHPDMPKEVFKDMWDTISAKKTWYGIVKNKKKWGGHYWVKTLVMPILDINGDIFEYISVRTDITEFKNIQDELNQVTGAVNRW